MRHDVIVVGGGVIARCVALELSSRGLSVATVSKSSTLDRTASVAAGAMLGAFAEFVQSKWLFADQEEARLRISAGRMWEEWFRTHISGSQADTAIRRGTFIVANNTGSHDDENIHFIKAQADAWAEKNQWVDPRDVPGLEPHKLARPQRVLSLPTEGYIESRVLMQALCAAIGADPAITEIDEDVTAIDAASRGGTVRTLAGQALHGQIIVVAAGANTLRLLPWLDLRVKGRPLTMLGGRGTSMVVDSTIPFPGVLRTPNRDFACGSHVVPLSDGRIYIGATNRLEKNDFSDPKPSVGELHALCHSLANEISHQLRLAPVLEMRAGYRPISSDGYPLFGHTGHDGILIASGTYRNGILMAPAIARSVADDILSGGQRDGGVFSPLNRDRLHNDRNPDHELLGSVGQMVSFLQEPDGKLPFNRACELESLIRGLLGNALCGGEFSQVQDVVRGMLDRYPIQEALPLILYEMSQ
ncbi:NAD(P)/FAD-dependent oxidoreductase [Paracoccus sulfuroxidans]|uniref:Glycine/D-amino acid oxidase-like deaminating enzyme n=1 Tax=Paracoccus sulfuroxidans TaxID=384678 RepID=A0A562NFT0_9RHOB|nr:FAD-dependent oxidoreductase [Paracoccus sulfuroxidans]TWI30954.1 glycine/D-amino acid oxidase-like deaminating enzyme [Paracoccus sulfuroxidans]